MPTIRTSAGSSVCAAIIGNSTAMDAAMAAPDSTLTPTVIIPSRATHTVIPANMTARPAVPAAVTTASWTLSPRRIPERTRVRMNSE